MTQEAIRRADTICASTIDLVQRSKSASLQGRITRWVFRSRRRALLGAVAIVSCNWAASQGVVVGNPPKGSPIECASLLVLAADDAKTMYTTSPYVHLKDLFCVMWSPNEPNHWVAGPTWYTDSSRPDLGWTGTVFPSGTLYDALGHYATSGYTYSATRAAYSVTYAPNCTGLGMTGAKSQNGTGCICDSSQGWFANGQGTACVNPSFFNLKATEPPKRCDLGPNQANTRTQNPIWPLEGVKTKDIDLGFSVAGKRMVLSYTTAPSLLLNAIWVYGQTSYKTAGISTMAQFGPNWSTPLHKALMLSADSYRARIRRGDGRVQTFGFVGSLNSYASLSSNNSQLVQAAGTYQFGVDAAQTKAGWYYSPGNFTYTDRDEGVVEVYGPQGRLLYEVDLLGRKTTYGYDATGNLVSVTDAFGKTVSFTYATRLAACAWCVQASDDPVLSIVATSMKAPDGSMYAFAYDGNNNLTGITYPDGTTQGFIYPAGPPGSMTWTLQGLVDEKGVTWQQYNYDSQGRPVSSQLAGGVDAVTVDYGGNAVAIAATTETDPNLPQIGAIRTFGWATRGMVTVTDRGVVHSLSVDTVDGRPRETSKSQPAGSGCNSTTSARSYDAQGNTILRDFFDGTRECYGFDSENRLVTKVGGLSVGTSCASVVAAGAALPAGARKETFEYLPSYNMKVKVTAPKKIVTSVFNGRTDPQTSAVLNCAPPTALDGVGAPIAVVCKEIEQATTDPVGAAGANAQVDTMTPALTTRYTYDAYGRVLTTTDPRGNITTYAYYADNSPAPANVSLLLHADGANGSVAVLDASPNSYLLTGSGSAQITTTQSKFGGASMYFSGAGGAFTAPMTSAMDVGAAEFTWEGWFYPTSTTADQALFTLGKAAPSAGSDLSMGVHFYGASKAGRVAGWVYNGATFASVQSLVALVANTWNHIVFERVGSKLFLYLNGVLQGDAAALTANPMQTGYTMSVGDWSFPGQPRPTAGYLDEVRLVKGKGLYLANFSLPSAPYSLMQHSIAALSSITNPQGQVTTFDSYDSADRLLQTTSPKGVITRYEYSPRGWVTRSSETAPGMATRTTDYSYDGVGQLTGVTQPDGSTLSYSYDAAHRLVGVTDAKGNSVNYTLDNVGNRIAEDIKDPTGVLQRSIGRSFDALNRLQQVSGAAQ